VTDGLYLSALSVASTGLIAYRTGDGAQRQLTWVDRTGTNLGTLGEPDDSLRAPSLSPDGRRVAVTRVVQGNFDIWLLDGARSSRVTFDPAQDQYPLWSPDGSQIVFRSNRTGVYDLYQKPSNGAGEDTLLLSSDQTKVPTSWSADGRFLLYHSISPQTNRDLWALPMTGEGDPFIVLQTPFDERWAKFSPDGRWLTYQSNASGRYEIYIRAFVAPLDNDASSATAMSGVWQISTTGGTYPTWSPDGQELYYLDPDANMMTVTFSVTGDSVEVGNPISLFPTRIVSGGTDDLALGWQYNVAPDGRFLINTLVGEGSTTPITLIQNWDPQAAQ
jgi:dipeptidyl aminopeptidase/acylaminoacyl peptidase